MSISLRSPAQDPRGLERARRFGLSLSWLAIALQTIHAVALLILPHPLLASDCVQVILPVVAVLACIVRQKTSATRQSLTWKVIGVAFAIWTLAEVAYLLELHLLPPVFPYNKIDDVLWLLFAVPLLLALSGCLEGGLSRISILDQAQATTSFLVAAVLVFSAPNTLSFNEAYEVQNLVLFLSCSARDSMAETYRGKRFFRDFGIYLLVYLVCAGVGNVLAHRGWQAGGLLDLFWTLPVTVFCVVSLRPDNGLPETYRDVDPVHPHTWATHMRDLSALGLAGLSMAASAFLVRSQPVPGCLFFGGSFIVLAIRTYIRSVELHKANQSLDESALSDPLTGLGNRAFLRRALERLSSAREFRDDGLVPALMFVDLDRFKAINDGLGHEVGDQVLVEIARRIRGALQASAVVCRMGGDEFVVLLNVQTEEESQAAAARILDVIRAPLWLGNKLLQVSASVGLVMSTAAEEWDELIRKADQAMYEAKRRGKNRVHLFSAELGATQASFALETDFRECLKNRELQVALQPIFALSGDTVAGFEALARWTHPVLGVIPPSTFIPLAEANGSILELGRQVLMGALDAVSRWNQTRSNTAWVSVNVSTLQLLDPEFLPFVLETLSRARLGPHLMHLEITESVMLSDDKSVIAGLVEARRHGMHVSLDDFGTGYSSLSYLLRFPTDEIKIDRGFIRGMDRDAQRIELVRMVLQLGVSLNKRVIAEGVETEQELEILSRMGCEFVQGYLLGEPFPMEYLDVFPGRGEKHLSLSLEKSPISTFLQ